jgi:nicotinamidase-related amidase
VALPGDVTVHKHRSSAFFGTNLDMILRSNGIQTLVFTGCTTEGCVESTVRDAGFLDYFTVVARDGVQSDVPELHEASIRVMEAYRADLATTAEIMSALRTHARSEP